MSLPQTTPELLRFLDEKYPDKLPESGKEPLPEIMFRAGQRDVVRFLKDAQKLQEDRGLREHNKTINTGASK